MTGGGGRASYAPPLISSLSSHGTGASMECGPCSPRRGNHGRSPTPGGTDPGAAGGAHRLPAARRPAAPLPDARSPVLAPARPRPQPQAVMPSSAPLMAAAGRRWAPRHVVALRTAASALALARRSPARNDAVRLTECRCRKTKSQYTRAIWFTESFTDITADSLR